MPTRNAFLAVLMLLPAALVCAPCVAGSLLDGMRAVDLNNYAVGVAAAGSQNPYVGAGNNVFLYPYLTSFRHPSLTTSLLSVTDGNLGIRHITASEWEFRLQGRLQTRGPGAATGADRPVLEDRDWALEVGPLVGWRGWPVHVQLKSYWELPNRHDGFTAELDLSLPVSYFRGFFVPYIRLTHFSDDYSHYYYGVSERESTLTLSEYEPGAVSQFEAGIELGYELSPRWLLTSRVGIEFFDEAVRESPIIDRDYAWAGLVGLAYSAAVFNSQQRESNLAPRNLELRLSVANSTLDTEVSRTPASVGAVTPVRAEDTLGASDEEQVFQFDARLRLGHYHRLEFTAFELARSSATRLDRDITFGDRLYPAGAELDTRTALTLVRSAYSYSLIRDSQKELSVAGGLSFVSFDTVITENAVPGEERLSVNATLPTLGSRASITLGERWTLEADAFFFATEFDNYDGLMSHLSLGVDRQFGSAVRVGVGLDWFRLRLDAAEPGADESLKFTQFGPKLYVSGSF